MGDTSRGAQPSQGVNALLKLAGFQRRTLAETRIQGTPWWLAAPAVAAKCLDVLVLPVRLFNAAVETAVALAVVAVAVTGYMVYTGDIPQERVVAVLKPLGKKLIDTVQSAAAPLPAAPAVAADQAPDEK